MAGQRSRTWLVATVAGTLVAGALAAVALAAVVVYKNNFSSRGEFREIRAAGKAGKCERNWSEKRELMRVVVKAGPKACRSRPPVQGDSSHPDYTMGADAKISKSTAKKIRDKAYASVAVRIGGGKGYELRVFPREGRYALLRQPDSGAFPVGGTDPAIKGIAARNVLRLEVDGNQLRARVNGTVVANVTDPNHGPVDGTKLEFRLGSTANTSKNTHGSFDRLRVFVPDP